MSKKLNIAERFELAVPCSTSVSVAGATLRPEETGFPEPVDKKPVLSCTRQDSNRNQGILNCPTHHRANLAAIVKLYRSVKVVGALIVCILAI